MRNLIYVTLLLTAGLQINADAQEPTWYGSKSSHTEGFIVQEPGNISIHANGDILRLDSLKRLKPTLPDGYRVQIYFGKREEAQEKRAAFLRQHTEKGAYISYLAPNFRLRVGDFRNRIDAEKFKQSLAATFPGAYLVKDKIELPPIIEPGSK